MAAMANRTGDRRRESRTPASRTVQYRFLRPRSASSGFKEATALDLSLHGIRLAMDDEIPSGERMEIFVLGPKGDLEVSGIVEAVRCARKPVTDHVFNEYYNPDSMTRYEVGCRSAGSVLFDRPDVVR
jgi:hypothetical protein